MIRSQTWSRAIAVTAAQLNVRFNSEGASRVKGDVDAVGKSVANSGRNSQALGAGFLGMGAGIAAGFGVGVKAAMSFEQGMANVRSVSGATGAEFDELSDAALRIGKDTSFSANEATLAIEELSKAGVSVEDILSGAADGATALAAATGTELPQAAAAVATSLNVFSLSGDQATRVANVFAAGANKAATDVGQLQAGLAQGGAVFAMYGMTVEESVGALALFSDYGIQGSDAATSMKAALTTMNSGVGASAKEMAKLGIEMYDANGEFVGMDGLAGELQRTLGGLSEEERNLALTRLGGTDGMRALNILYQEGAAGVDEYTAAVTGTDAATSASAIRMDTLSGAMEELSGSVETLMIVFLSGLLPGIRVVVDAITGFTNFLINLPGPVQGVIVGLTALAGVVATLGGVFLLFGPQIAAALGILGGISFGPIIAGVAAVAGVAGLVYAGWKTDFMGLRRLTQRAFSPITGMIDRFRDTWDDLGGTSDVLSRFFKGTGQAAAITGPINAVSRALSALSASVRGIGGGDIPFFNTFANGLDQVAAATNRAGEFAHYLAEGYRYARTQGASPLSAALRAMNLALGGEAFEGVNGKIRAFAEALERAADAFDAGGLSGLIGQMRTEISGLASALGSINVGAIAVSIGGWAVEQAVDLGTAVYDWIVGTALPAMGRAAVTVYDWAVSIGSWLVSAATDVWEAVKQWVMGGDVGAGDGTGGAGGGQASIPLGMVAAKITDWIVTAAIDIGLRVLSFVQTAKATITRVATDIGRFAVKIADWTVTAGIDIGLRVLSFIQSAKGTITRVATDIGRFAVKIADWTISAAVDIGLRVLSFVQSAKGTISRIATDIGAFAVKIADWTISAAVDVGLRVLAFIQSAKGTITRVATDIGAFAVKIADWTVTAAIDVGLRVLSFVQSAKDTITRIATDIGEFAVKIADWTVSAAVNIGSAVVSWIRDVALPSLPAFTAGVSEVAVKIADWTVSAAVDLGTAVDDWITGTALPLFEVSPATMATMQAKGTDVGQQIGAVFMDSLITGLSALGGGGGGQVNRPGSVAAGASGSYAGNIITAALVFIDGFIDGFITGAKAKIEAADWASISDSFVTEMDALSKSFTGVELWTDKDSETFSEPFDQIIQMLKDFDRDMSRASEGLRDLFTDPIDTIRAGWENLTGWIEDEINRTIDDINSLIGKLNQLPGVDISMLGNIGTEADGSSQGVRNLANAFGAVESAASAANAAIGLVNAPPDLGRGGVGSGEDLEASRNIQSAGGVGASFQMPNFGPILTGLQNIKSEMQSTITVAGSLKTAIASISSGGGIGAAVGAGASGAAGAAMAAVGGGGGPFAALKTGADQLKTTISGLSTALTTFNAGPLTTLNAGFPILGATVAAFNAGPLTTLNAAFPILSATMTAFNAGPLTLLNAGFPILAATMTAFNAGPLTLLNAGFPILSATMTAFNAGPLTLLNAGFPILAATMTAFNAGPLTLLNAGFPILSATMTAFNAGPLTLLNAGFPILSATILAFNAGPLTTLNAAFPILTATMLAFNAGPLTLLNAGFPILGATMAAFNAGPLTTLNAGFPILGATMLAFNAGPLTTLNAGFPIVGASATALGVTLDTVGGNVTTFGGTVTTMVGEVSSGFAEMSSSASSNMAALSSAVQTGMSNASSAIRGEAGQWPGLISGFAGAMRGAGQSVGAAASAGVAAGMRSNLGSIRSAANEIVSQVDRALRSAARISSPSRLTAEVGRQLGAGVAVGMDGQLRNVMWSASALALAGVPVLPRSSTPAFSGSAARGAQYGASAQGGSPIHITIHVAGNVTSEDDLAMTILRAVNEGLSEGTSQRNRAMGMT